jgi:tyrosyl-tRNA synthetase
MLGAGCQVKIWIADWFAVLNLKMGGNLNKIQTAGNYMITIWKALGMDMDRDRVEFLWASKEIDKCRDEYWSLVFDIALKSTLSRIVRCIYTHLDCMFVQRL